MSMGTLTAQSMGARNEGALYIEAGQTESAAFDLSAYTLAGIITPAALTSSTLQFLVSTDDWQYFPLCNAGNQRIALTVATNEARAYPLKPEDFRAWRFVKMQAGAAESAQRRYLIVVRAE